MQCRPTLPPRLSLQLGLWSSRGTGVVWVALLPPPCSNAAGAAKRWFICSPWCCTLSPAREGRERKVTVFVRGGRNSCVSYFTGEVGRQEGRSRPMQCSPQFPDLSCSREGKAVPHFLSGKVFAHLNLPESIPAAPQHLCCADQLEMGMQTPSSIGVLWTSSPWGQPRWLSGVKGFLRSHSVFLPSMPHQPLGSAWPVATLKSYFLAGKEVLCVQGPDSAPVLTTGMGQQLGCASGLLGEGMLCKARQFSKIRDNLIFRADF